MVTTAANKPRKRRNKVRKVGLRNPEWSMRSPVRKLPKVLPQNQDKELKDRARLSFLEELHVLDRCSHEIDINASKIAVIWPALKPIEIRQVPIRIDSLLPINSVVADRM